MVSGFGIRASMPASVVRQRRCTEQRKEGYVVWDGLHNAGCRSQLGCVRARVGASAGIIYTDDSAD